MYYTRPYRPDENEEEEQEEELDPTLYDRIESQWLAFSETSLIFCTLSASTSVALLLRAFGFAPVIFATLGIVSIIAVLLAVINWSQMSQCLKTRLFLCLLAASVATVIVTTDIVIDWIKLNPVTMNRIVSASAILATVVMALMFVFLARKVKNACQK